MQVAAFGAVASHSEDVAALASRVAERAAEINNENATVAGTNNAAGKMKLRILTSPLLSTLRRIATFDRATAKCELLCCSGINAPRVGAELNRPQPPSCRRSALKRPMNFHRLAHKASAEEPALSYAMAFVYAVSRATHS